MKVLVLVLLLSVCSLLALARQTDTDAGSGRPYYYGEESFQQWAQSRQGRFRVLEPFTHELLEDAAVGNYRVAELEAAPRAFVQPKYHDADVVAFVKGGEGVVVLLRGGGRRESFCVREGDVMAIPAGAVVYSANTHQSEWFRVVMLFIPVDVSTSGRFEEFFPIGGGNPESFLSVFSDDVIQASFNTSREEWAKVFEKQNEGEITTASEEQIQELTRSCTRGDSGPSSLTGKTPTYSNSHGRYYETTGDEHPHLRPLGLEVALANISLGSIVAPSYSTRATNIAIVVSGEGFFEMATTLDVSGGLSSSQRREGAHGSYRRVMSRITEGSVIVIPAGYPAVLVAGGEAKNLAVLCFQVNANLDEKVFLAGTNSVLRLLDGAAKLLAFGVGEVDVDHVIGAQQDAVFLRGPQSM